MKIVFFELEKWEDQYFKENLSDFQVVFTEERLTLETASSAKDAEIISTFIYSEIDKKIIDSLPKLKSIVTRSTGFDHIDIEYCREKNIPVLNIPSYGVSSVAEHTFALILTISRKIIPSVERTKVGNFKQDGLEGFDLYGKTLGVVGEGRIGKKIIEIAKAFGMKVLVYTKNPNPNIENVEDVSFDELIKKSDIVTFHVPYTKETHHMINTKNIENFKKGSVLINTARGAIIETQAIIEGLDKGIFSAVGLDVLEEECDMREEKELLTKEFLKSCNLEVQLLNHVLLTRDNAIITPHNAFNSKESMEEILKVTVEDIKSIDSSKLLNRVT